MLKENILKSLKAINDEIINNYKAQIIGIFGSYARDK